MGRTHRSPVPMQALTVLGWPRAGHGDTQQGCIKFRLHQATLRQLWSVWPGRSRKADIPQSLNKSAGNRSLASPPRPLLRGLSHVLLSWILCRVVCQGNAHEGVLPLWPEDHRRSLQQSPSPLALLVEEAGESGFTLL